MKMQNITNNILQSTIQGNNSSNSGFMRSIIKYHTIGGTIKRLHYNFDNLVINHCRDDLKRLDLLKVQLKKLFFYKKYLVIINSNKPTAKLKIINKVLEFEHTFKYKHFILVFFLINGGYILGSIACKCKGLKKKF